MVRRTLLAAFAAMILASSAAAATITYTLDLSGAPGTFTLKGQTSAGDNGGLVFYSVPLTGSVLTVDNRGPNVINSANFAPAGFGAFRSADVLAATANPIISGSQDVVSGPPANRIYGFGQESSSYVGKGITPAFLPDATSDIAWSVPMVLATGTYTGTLGFNSQSVELTGNVWDAAGGSAAPQATIQTVIVNIPEPATIAMLGLAMVGCFGLIRRRSA
jgi:PEP-CTERM motif